MAKKALSHLEVLETAERSGDSGAALLKNFANLYGSRLQYLDWPSI
jgi:hypothetical protein